MDQETFRRVMEEDLAPMLAGELKKDPLPSTARELTIAYEGPCRLLVKPTRDTAYRFAIDRSQSFSPQEKQLAEDFINQLEAIAKIDSGIYERDLLRALPTRVIAHHMGSGEVLHSILDHLQIWSAQTYEGQRIVAAVGIQDAPGNARLPLHTLWGEDYGPVMTNGFDTLLEVDSVGNVHGLVHLDVPAVVSRKAPYRLGQIAEWTNGGATAVVLNRNGEILVFRDASLHFVRRNGRWVHYSHDVNIRRLSPPLGQNLRNAIYESCLDVSYARCGGCIGVLSYHNRENTDELIAEPDLLNSSDTYKVRLIRAAVAGRPFQEIDRRIRQELLALDGALVLDHKGNLFTAGAILKVPEGSVGGGGRRAAAVAISKRGLGVKVSQDGSIIGFHDGKTSLTT